MGSFSIPIIYTELEEDRGCLDSTGEDNQLILNQMCCLLSGKCAHSYGEGVFESHQTQVK